MNPVKNLTSNDWKNKRLTKKYTQAQSQLRKLCQQEFACAEDPFNAAKLLETQLPFHQLANIEVIKYSQHRGPSRPRKNYQPTPISHIQAEIVPKETAITIATEHWWQVYSCHQCS
ncbi:hypothetical protein RintRC_2524 [Richelia intracellularis]|nr:hypothetical protein RintRC_2524 [Richelia intracellularis]